MNVTTKRFDVNECHQKKAKAQGSEIMISFKKRYWVNEFSQK